MSVRGTALRCARIIRPSLGFPLVYVRPLVLDSFFALVGGVRFPNGRADGAVVVLEADEVPTRTSSLRRNCYGALVYGQNRGERLFG